MVNAGTVSERGSDSRKINYEPTHYGPLEPIVNMSYHSLFTVLENIVQIKGLHKFINILNSLLCLKVQTMVWTAFYLTF